MGNSDLVFSLTQEQYGRLNEYRLARIRRCMRERNVDLCVLNNPVSLRYAMDYDEYQLFQAHIPTVYLLVPIEGPLRMYGAARRDYLNVEEYQRPHFISVFDAGLDLDTAAKTFLSDIGDFRHQLGLSGKVAFERFSPFVTQRALSAGWTVVDAEVIVEHARTVKSAEELLCMRHSIAVAQEGIAAMHVAMKPGISENELLSILHQVNIAYGGSWIDGRMLASGARTNPWLQEATHKPIALNELVGFDTDLIGPSGYLADISRTWLCGDKANAQQRAAYRHAYDEVTYNMSLLQPGISFQELAAKAFKRDEKYIPNRYVCSFHGAGLCDEYPKIYYEGDWPADTYDGVLEENMVLCVESFSGAFGEKEGVKLENQVLITASGYELLSDYSYDERLLGSH
ncbi:MAG: aminopeptidase P family protein [Oceanospirillaceae bacterium]|nr:aminopeptidase P family protein [Oceanospirillaceae bacterium]